MIRVVHQKRSALNQPSHYVGRPTVLGNPFTHLTRDTKAIEIVPTVEMAVARYSQWFYQQMKTNSDFRLAVSKLAVEYQNTGYLNLACWCKDELQPRPTDHVCHADVIRDFLHITYPVRTYYRANQILLEDEK